MLGLKLIHVSKRGPRHQLIELQYKVREQTHERILSSPFLLWYHFSVHSHISKAIWQLWCWMLFLGTIEYICVLYHPSRLRLCWFLKTFVVEGNQPFILHSRYYENGKPSHARSQGIKYHGIDWYISEYHDSSTGNVTIDCTVYASNLPCNVKMCL